MSLHSVPSQWPEGWKDEAECEECKSSTRDWCVCAWFQKRLRALRLPEIMEEE